MQPFQPVTDRISSELESIVAADMIRHSLPDKQLPESLYYILVILATVNGDRQALTGELVDYGHPLNQSFLIINCLRLVAAAVARHFQNLTRPTL